MSNEKRCGGEAGIGNVDRQMRQLEQTKTGISGDVGTVLCDQNER